ncbi:hypothetical protein ZWY2020_031282 [Hordeum vulgare]|nr:hypothetical protein ZWY2020_031282 [Hordeum vulgare]
MGSPPAGRGLGLVGGRFWALPDDDDDLQNAPAASPTPSDIVCESILVEYSEEQVAESIDGFVPDSDPAWEGLTANDEDRVEYVAQTHPILDSPGMILTEIEEVTDVVKEGPLSADSPTGYKDRGIRSGITGGSKAIPGFPSRSGTARSIPALMAARQPSAPAASASTGATPAVTAPAAVGPVAGVAATALAGAREPKVPDGQGRGPAGAVVVGPIGWPEEVLGEEPINGGVPSSHPKATLSKEPLDRISGKEAGAEYAIMVGIILGLYGRKSHRRTGGKMTPRQHSE